MASPSDSEELVKDLFRAVMKDDAAALEQIRASSAIDILTVRNSANQTPLQLATERGKKDVKAYLEGRKKGGAGAASAGKAGLAPSASRPSPAAAAPSPIDEQVQQLFRAVMRDDAAEVRKLAASGLDVAVLQNKSKQTPLQLARERGKEAVLACLAELLPSLVDEAPFSSSAVLAVESPVSAATPAPVEDKVLVLFRAVMRDDAAAVQQIAEEGFDVLTAANKSGQTAQQLAVERGKEAVQKLLARLASAAEEAAPTKAAVDSAAAAKAAITAAVATAAEE
ncbi:unnamed protein product, partial [Polarella glacialis]